MRRWLGAGAVALGLFASGMAHEALGGPGFRETGEASWYAPSLDGKPTASGEPYDPAALTAAHPELRFGSEVEVTNLRNGRTVVVAINDRGPFTGGRILDVSEAAARRLGVLQAGVTRVRIGLAR
jgi:rare lipoprotein A